jgi:hypothetical protein
MRSTIALDDELITRAKVLECSGGAPRGEPLILTNYFLEH